MKGYMFKVEFVVWGRSSQARAKEDLQSYLLINDEGFNTKEPEFLGDLEVQPEKINPKEKDKRNDPGTN